MAGLKIIAVLISFTSLGQCDYIRQTPRGILSPTALYSGADNVLPNQQQELKNQIVYNFNYNDDDHLYKKVDDGLYGRQHENGFENEYRNIQNTQFIYDQYGNGHNADSPGQYKKLYENSFAEAIKPNIETINEYTTTYENNPSNIETNIKYVPSQVPPLAYNKYIIREQYTPNEFQHESGNIQTDKYFGTHNTEVNIKPNNQIADHIANDVFNEPHRSQLHRTTYYKDGKTLNLEQVIPASESYENGYGYAKPNIDIINKPVVTYVNQPMIVQHKYNNAYRTISDYFPDEYILNSGSNKPIGGIAHQPNLEIIKYNINDQDPGNIFTYNTETKSIPFEVPKSQSNSIKSTTQMFNTFAEPVHGNYPLHSFANSNNIKPYPINAQLHDVPTNDKVEDPVSETYIESLQQSLPAGQSQLNFHADFGNGHETILGSEHQNYIQPQLFQEQTTESNIYPAHIHNINLDPMKSYKKDQVQYHNPQVEATGDYTLHIYKHSQNSLYGLNSDHTQSNLKNNGYKTIVTNQDGDKVSGIFNHYYLQPTVTDIEGIKPLDYSLNAEQSSRYNPNVYGINSVAKVYDSENGSYNSNLHNSYQNVTYGYSARPSHHVSGVHDYSTNSNNNDHRNYVAGGYLINDDSVYQTIAQRSSNAENSKYEQNTYKTITNISNNYDVNQQSHSPGYTSDEYDGNKIESIELTTSGYESSTYQSNGYKYSIPKTNDFETYDHEIKPRKSVGLKTEDYKFIQLKPYPYNTIQTEHASIGNTESLPLKSNDVSNDQKFNLTRDNESMKSNKTEMNGGSSVYVSVTHGNSSYSYNIKQ